MEINRKKMSKKKIQKPFDLKAWKNGAKVETRGGSSVRILCTDAKNDTGCIVGLLKISPIREDIKEWYTNGQFYKCRADALDLVIVEEIEIPEPERWAETQNAVGKGRYVDEESENGWDYFVYLNDENNYRFFATEKQAKSALVMARISQLMAHDERYGGVVTDEEWKDDSLPKYVITRLKNCHEPGRVFDLYYFLAFHTPQQRNLFLDENERLIKDYLMTD